MAGFLKNAARKVVLDLIRGRVRVRIELTRTRAGSLAVMPPQRLQVLADIDGDAVASAIEESDNATIRIVLGSTKHEIQVKP